MLLDIVSAFDTPRQKQAYSLAVVREHQLTNYTTWPEALSHIF